MLERAYAANVSARKARGVSDRSTADEAVDLPDGAELDLNLDEAAADSMNEQEQAALTRALERSLAQADAGELIEADEVLAELEQRS